MKKLLNPYPLLTAVTLACAGLLYGCAESNGQDTQDTADPVGAAQAQDVQAKDSVGSEAGQQAKAGSTDGFVRVEDSLTIQASEFKYEPNKLEIPVDTEVTLVLKNEGTLAHNLHIRKDGDAKNQTKTIQTDAKDSLTVKFTETGTYRFRCEVAGHKEAGMTGVIRVVDE